MLDFNFASRLGRKLVIKKAKEKLIHLPTAQTSSRSHGGLQS
jgi:hypothetical protein